MKTRLIITGCCILLLLIGHFVFHNTDIPVKIITVFFLGFIFTMMFLIFNKIAKIAKERKKELEK
jgi:hypothetical protein